MFVRGIARHVLVMFRRVSATEQPICPSVVLDECF